MCVKPDLIIGAGSTRLFCMFLIKGNFSKHISSCTFWIIRTKIFFPQLFIIFLVNCNVSTLKLIIFLQVWIICNVIIMKNMLLIISYAWESVEGLSGFCRVNSKRIANSGKLIFINDAITYKNILWCCNLLYEKNNNFTYLRYPEAQTSNPCKLSPIHQSFLCFSTIGQILRGKSS